jgi:hypothetical protein
MVAALTPDYEVLTNQGDALVLVYIDSVALQLNLSYYSNEHRILYVLRALEYNSTILFKWHKHWLVSVHRLAIYLITTVYILV